jgi:hypothetical protein
MFGLPKEAVGAIIAAIVAGFVALMSLIISKEQKVSEFRQQWIDALRVDVAKFISCAHSAAFVRMVGAKDKSADYKDFFQPYGEVLEIAARIRLRLNAREKTCQALLEALDKIIKRARANDTTHPSMSEVTDELTALTLLVLRQEWTRVQEGEFTYRWTRRILLVMVVVLVLTLALYLVSSVHALRVK